MIFRFVFSRNVAIASVVFIISNEQSLYIAGNFSCNRDPELVIRTTETGSFHSPCYDGTTTAYPDELTVGFKLINITFDSSDLHGEGCSIISLRKNYYS